MGRLQQVQRSKYRDSDMMEWENRRGSKKGNKSRYIQESSNRGWTTIEKQKGKMEVIHKNERRHSQDRRRLKEIWKRPTRDNSTPPTISHL